MNWNEYVERVAGDETQATIAHKLGVSGPTISRWKKFGPRPENVSTFARVYDRPVLEAFVAAGYITPEEANEQPTAAPSLTSLSNDELVNELARRLKAGEGDASTPLTHAAGSAAKANVHELFTDPPAEEKSVAWRTRNRDKEAQERQDADAERPDD